MLPFTRACLLLVVVASSTRGAWVQPRPVGSRFFPPPIDSNCVTQAAAPESRVKLSSGTVRMASSSDAPCRRRPAAGYSRSDILKGAALAVVGLTVASTGAARAEARLVDEGAWVSSRPQQQQEPLQQAPGSSGGEEVSGLEQQPLERTPTTTTLAAAAEEERGSSGLSEFVSGLAGGAASRASKELLLHPIDTIKTRLQYSRAGGEVPPEELFKDLYSGVWPALLVGTPAGAAFFGTKDLLKGLAKQQWGSEYRELTTIAAVFIANLPYWGIRTPAEVIKTRQQTGLANGTLSAVSSLYEEQGLAGLYSGLSSNVAYAFPADAIKFLVYESLQRRWAASLGRSKLSPIESSVCGSAASCVAQVLSTPLDVVRTRLMTQGPATSSSSKGEGEDYLGIIDCLQRITREEGPAKLFSGLVPRLTRAVLSGAIQFSSYEFTKAFFKS